MKSLSPLLILGAVLASMIASTVPLPVRAQVEPTPILGPPVVVTPLVTPAASAEAAPTLPTQGSGAASTEATEPTAQRAAPTPDACELNDTPAQACPLPLDTVSGPFTIVPERDQDFYRLELPQEASIQTLITVRSTPGLDLVLSARQGDTLVASGTFSLTLAPTIVGPVMLRVENRDPRPAAGEQYRIEVRRGIVAPTRPESEQQNASVPDILENNWSFDTATAVGVDLVYDLSFACPDPRPDACPGGDHDYLFVPVKAGMAYLIATFDLDPGVDSVVELFWGSTATAIAGSDDYAPGGALSALHWTAPSDGILGIRIAPRNGGLHQQLPAAKTGYRFAVATIAGELARKLEETIRAQANVPKPTPTAAPVAAPAGSSSGGGNGRGTGAPAAPPPVGGGVVQESISAGPAIIIRETVLRRDPNERATTLATLAPETQVSVRGPVSGLWVSVESEASILPGWVRWSDLQRVPSASPESAAAEAGTPPAPTSIGAGPSTGLESPHSQQALGATTRAGASASASPGDTAIVSVSALDPALPSLPPSPVARVPFTLAVTIAATDRPLTTGSTLGMATPTPNLSQPVAQVRVQLLNVFGDVLAEGLTTTQGLVTLSRDVQPGQALLVRMPAWGVELPLAPQQSRLIVTIPEARP